MKPSHVRELLSRLGRSALASSIAGVAVAGVDVAYAGGSARLDWLADAGLVAPVALAIGLASGVAALFVDSARAPSPSTLVDALRVRAKGRPADVAAFAPLVVLAAFAWMTLSAHLARALLGVEVSAPLVGAAIAAGALGVGLFAALAALTLTPPLRRALAKASDKHRACVDPAVTSAVALAVVALLFAFGMMSGGLSGEGGLFGIYGVFRRPELDLRAPTLALALALAGFFGPALLARPRSFAAFALAVLPLALTARASSALNVEPETTQRIERGAPLGHLSLAALRKLTDRDHDGVSGRFGGGDCNDRDAQINPLATDHPNDGVDQDCSGSDFDAKALAALTPEVPKGKAEAARAKVPEDLSIVLITVDTMRADLGFLGYPKPVSPNLDRLAADSTVFERAYSLASYTGKSVGPLLIGKYCSETHRNWGHFNKFGPEDTFVAERLKSAGYHTMSVHGHRYFGKWGGIERGFDVVDMSAAPPESAKWDVASDATSEKLSDAALKLLADPENTKGKFFLWIHYLDPHADYLHHDGLPDFGNDQRGAYDGEIAFTDQHIGRVLDAIHAAPWGKNTAIVVTSDHGEAFGEHKMYRHGFELWEELVRVPLVVHVPGAEPSRVHVRRSAIDVVPTLLELAHVPIPDGHDPNDFVSGVSLLPDVFLPKGEKAAPRDVLVDMPGGPYNDPRRSLIHGDLKLTISGGTHQELYDLAADPGERKNLFGSGAEKSILPVYDAAKARLREIRVTGPRK